ncbi:GTPase [Promethearchaeum syntrophicum]|uniref:GTPase n=1 Tax=Promethearchaeum syntrophicum TaxID=2594042 RepID=A0A5B9DEV2_9ARCH|nr:GTPase [Candidatus Prometheoarchaeum syntrophicum]QEE17313.1 hypothetical protein DSAG12_03146 [Candidatus Prometheoarchaeum syntrophicum]
MSEEFDIKSEIKSSYPKSFKISRGLIHKITQFFMQSGAKLNEILEYNYGDKLVLILSQEIDLHQSNEIIALILSPNEVPQKKEFIDFILNNIENFYQNNKQERYAKFEVFARQFFSESEAKKLLFIGFPSAGKTSIKKSIFDKEDPKELLGDSSPEPTRGLVHFIYSWFNASIGIVDSSGQEFDSYVSDGNEEQLRAFEGSDIIIYVFDVINWKEQSEKVIDNLKKIISTKEVISPPNSKIYAFCHKIDLLSDPDKDSILKVKQILEKDLNIKATFSSIQPELIHTLFRSMELILKDTRKK